MNKVFKVIWSEARNAYVVVSEMAKNHGTKSCSTKKLLAMLIATGVMTCASVAPAMAANLAPEDTKIEAGDGANASGEGSVAIGNNAQASGLVAIAIGRDAVASGGDSIAIGSQTKATKQYSVAVGNDIGFTAYAGTAVGQQAYASGDNSTAIGNMTNVDADWNAAHQGQWRNAGVQSTAIGAYAGSWGLASAAVGGFSKAEGQLATAIGYHSQANVDYGTALGDYSEVKAGWGAAIGASSVADREAGVVGAFAPEGADSLTWKANAGAVSVGSETITRQITNVAVGSEATDAVNVAQLKATTENAGWNLSTGKEITNPTKVKSGATVDFSGDDENITVSKEETDYATLVNVKLNRNLNVDSIHAGDFFMNNDMGIGFGGEAYITQSGLNANDKVITNVAAGVYNTDAVNVGQLKEVEEVAANANKGWNLSTNGVATSAINVAPGEYVDFSGDQNVSVSKDAKDGVNTVKVELNKDLVGIESVSNDGASLILNGTATEAGKHSKVVNGSNINVEEFDNDGQKIYKVNLNKDIMLGDLTGKYVSISGTNGTIEATGAIATKDRVYADKGAKLADIDVTGDKISNGASSIVLDGSNVKVNDKVTIDQNGKISGVAAGEISSTSTDAINGSQLHQTNENVAANRADIDKNKADIAALDNRVTKNEQDIKQNAADIAQNKADIATNKADIATNKADIATNKANIAQNAADIKKVEELAKKHTTVTAGDNITVTEDTNKDGGKEYKVALDKDINLDSVTTGQTVMNNDGLKVGKDVSVTATAVTAGKTSISDEGVKVGDKTYISDKGLNANDQKVTNVAAGELSETSKDAVNGSQLYATNQEVVNNTNRINKLGSRVNKVGAGAAALAALHPMDFDPDDKLTFSAGYGNYAGENAAAIGAYYRPDEKVMFSVAGTVGNGENMVNAGVSFALDRTNHVSNSRTALAREVIDLRGQLAVMGAKMAKMEKAFGMLDETKTKLFPDVPANHWAYEYIAKLAGNGYIEGYPDGNFGGDRLMTRYEFAAMLYRAIENGAALEEKIIKEFEPELGRIRVDRISGEDGDRDKIERVRVNDTKGERDHYGNKLAK